MWNWGWTYHGLYFNNCGVGIDISAGGTAKVETGSITLIDSQFQNTPVAILTAWTQNSNPATAGSLVMENLALFNVPEIVKGPSGTLLAGSTGIMGLAAWGNGHRYTPNGPNEFAGAFTPNTRPASLLSSGRYYVRSKPQYENRAVSDFVSIKSAGAKGDAVTDDTTAIQTVIDAAVATGKIVFIDYGLYRVTRTIRIPPGLKMVGESFATIMSSGSFFNDMNNPKPVLQVGAFSGEQGTVELSDFIVSTQGAQAGAVLIEWNLATPAGSPPSGMWDVHTRIGGFAGSQQLVAECVKTPSDPTVRPQCIVAYMAMHVTKQATGLYMENVWLWMADHDIEDPALTQITLYSGRGLYIESATGTFWLWGTGSEHHVLYQYQFVNTQNIFAGQIQTETPYFAPQPNALVPFPPVAALNDPDFRASCQGVAGNCAAAWGLRVINSKNILIYGAGLYSFFSNYSTTCSTFEAGQTCQERITSIEGSGSSNVNIYNLNTIGTRQMINRDGAQVAWYADNVNNFPSCIAVFKSG